ncbi:hypothetical protein AAOE16_06690 [Ekhidna sp. MALMAid0563]|uniref:hypothetical protein n=1 Tax=Ekhidna sp. MALMAid0563 TaxID=3143937 RepID=UPI0032DE6182
MKKEEVTSGDAKEVKPLTKNDINELKLIIHDSTGIKIPDIGMLTDDNILLGLRSAKSKKSIFSKLTAFSFAISNRSATPYSDLWYLIIFVIKSTWAIKTSGLKRVSFFKLFSYMLPRDSREEYVADLMEMNKDLRADGTPKFVIYLTNIAHFTSIVFHGLFFKLSGYFYPSRKKVDD